MKVATCSIVRLENNYLVEFVEHYKNIGFDHMFIYDNNRENHEHPEEVLQKYIDENFVTVINYRNHELYPMTIALNKAFKDCWDNNKNEYDWILFCDNDEFLNFSKDKNIKEYLSREEINKCDVIKINWKCYDDNDLIYYENKPLKERFTHLCWDNPYNFSENRHIKTFLHNTLKDTEIIYNYSAAHSPILECLSNKITGDNTGRIIQQNEMYQHCLTYINYDLCWLDHYRMKTIDEYVNNKFKKLTSQGYTAIDFSNNLFFEYNKYTVEKEKFILENICSKSKNCIYTVILGNYDKLNEPEYITEGWDYICFTDNKNFKSDVWKIILVTDEWKNDFIWLNPEHFKDKVNQYLNRKIKVQPHYYLGKYNFSIYIDGNIKIKGDLNDFKKNYIDVPGSYKNIMWVLEHDREGLYAEIDKCIELKKDYISKLNKLKEFYINENVPKKLGMTHNCVIARYHLDQKCKNTMDSWWEMIKKYTVRDQCSLIYILYKKNLINNICIIKNNDINKYINYYESCGIHTKNLNIALISLIENLNNLDDFLDYYSNQNINTIFLCYNNLDNNLLKEYIDKYNSKINIVLYNENINKCYNDIILEKYKDRYDYYFLFNTNDIISGKNINFYLSRCEIRDADFIRIPKLTKILSLNNIYKDDTNYKNDYNLTVKPLKFKLNTSLILKYKDNLNNINNDTLYYKDNNYIGKDINGNILTNKDDVYFYLEYNKYNNLSQEEYINKLYNELNIYLCHYIDFPKNNLLDNFLNIVEYLNYYNKDIKKEIISGILNDTSKLIKTY